jgi:hypothetical protein
MGYSMKRCSICREEYYGWGNNAEPVVEGGVCCNDCNAIVVIPVRLCMLVKKGKENDGGGAGERAEKDRGAP